MLREELDMETLVGIDPFGRFLGFISREAGEEEEDDDGGGGV